MGYMPDDEIGKAMCLGYGRIAEIRASKRPGGCVVNAWEQFKIPGILVEWPPLRQMNLQAVGQNVMGLVNICRTLGMLPGEPRKIPRSVHRGQQQLAGPPFGDHQGRG